MASRVHIDYFSQPSRSVVIFIKLCDLPVDIAPLRLAKGDHKKPEFKAMAGGFTQVPVLQEGDWSMVESCSILRYLATTKRAKSTGLPVADHWYPADPRRRARVDSALDWSHWGLRRWAAQLFWSKFVEKRADSDADVQKLRRGLDSALQALEECWLSNGGAKFVAGNELCLADLIITNELTQLELLDSSCPGSFDAVFATHGRARRYLREVEAASGAPFAEAHSFLRGVRRAAPKL